MRVSCTAFVLAVAGAASLWPAAARAQTVLRLADVPRRLLIIAVLICVGTPTVLGQGQGATIRVLVHSDEQPIADADVVVAGTTHRTDSSGSATLTVAPGAVQLTVVKAGYVVEIRAE